LHDRYYPLFKDLFIETNPVPIKAALAMRGRIKEEYPPAAGDDASKNRET